MPDAAPVLWIDGLTTLLEKEPLEQFRADVAIGHTLGEQLVKLLMKVNS